MHVFAKMLKSFPADDSYVCVCVHVGACKMPLGACCLVILGNLVSCYAQDFAPAPALVEAYLGLLSLTSSLAKEEHSSIKPGTHNV